MATEHALSTLFLEDAEDYSEIIEHGFVAATRQYEWILKFTYEVTKFLNRRPTEN